MSDRVEEAWPGEAASGLQLAALETGVPVAFGVLTCDTVDQALARIDRAADAVGDAELACRVLERPVGHSPSGSSKRRSWWWSRCPSFDRFVSR